MMLFAVSTPPTGPYKRARTTISVRWFRVKSSAQHSELLLAVLYVAASHFGLCGCIGARFGRAVASVEGISECNHTFVWWWYTDRPQQYWYFQTQGNGRVKLTDVFGKDDRARCSFVQFVMADDDDVEYIRRNEPGVPNVGGLDGPDRPPPSPPRTPVKHPYSGRDDDVPVDSDTDPSDPISHDP